MHILLKLASLLLQAVCWSVFHTPPFYRPLCTLGFLSIILSEKIFQAIAVLNIVIG